MATHKILMALSTLPHLKGLKAVAPIIISQESFIFEYIADGANLIEQITEFQPDLILLDYLLEKMDCIDAIQVIRQLPKYSTIPILVTSYRVFTADMVMECIEAGASDILFDPANPKEVLNSFLKALT